MIVNLLNGKIYIGRTNNPNNRWKEHIIVSKGNNKRRRLIHKAIAKYGSHNFEFRIIQQLNTFVEMNEAEMYWIRFYQTNIRRFGDEYGYNLSDGGDGGGSGPKSEEHKKSIGLGNKGKIRTPSMRLNLSLKKSIVSTKNLEIIRKMLIDNVSEYAIADYFNLSQGVISDMKLGKSHRYFFTDNDIELFNLRKTKTGERNGSSKLKNHQIIEIRTMLNSGISCTKIAKQYGVGKSTILRIKHGTHWKHVK